MQSVHINQLIQNENWEEFLFGENENLYQFISRFISSICLHDEHWRSQEKTALAHILLQSYTKLSQKDRQSIGDSLEFNTLWIKALDCIDNDILSFYDNTSGHALLLVQMYRYSKREFKNLVDVLDWWIDEILKLPVEEMYYHILYGLDVFTDVCKSESYYCMDILYTDCRDICEFLDKNNVDVQTLLAKVERLQGLMVTIPQ
jgi:hypothetical protein